MIRSLWITLLLFNSTVYAQRPPIPAVEIVGNETCRDCHEEMVEQWEKSAHATSLTRTTISEAATEMAKTLGITIAEIQTQASCIRCHLTQETLFGAPQVTLAVGCESCHGGAHEWIDEHNRKSIARSERVARATEHGMAHPHHLYSVAKTCYECHIIDDEQLVNQANHPALSKEFEILSWYSGEVAHNFLVDKGSSVKKHVSEQQPISSERKRRYYVTGKLLHLAALTRNLARATDAPIDKKGKFIKLENDDFTYAVQLAIAAKRIEHDIADVLEFASIPELEEAHALSTTLRWETGRQAELQAAAETFERLAKELAEKGSAASWSGIDPILAKLSERFSSKEVVKGPQAPTTNPKQLAQEETPKEPTPPDPTTTELDLKDQSIVGDAEMEIESIPTDDSPILEIDPGKRIPPRKQPHGQ